MARGAATSQPALAPLVYGAAEGAPFLGGAFGGEDAYLNDGLHFPGGGNPALGAEAVPVPVRQLDFRRIVRPPPR